MDTRSQDSVSLCFVCLRRVDLRTAWKLSNRYAHQTCIKIIAEAVVERIELSRFGKELLSGKGSGKT